MDKLSRFFKEKLSNGENECCWIFDVPEECIALSLFFIDPIDMVSFGTTCKIFNNLTKKSTTSMIDYWQFHCKFYHSLQNKSNSKYINRWSSHGILPFDIPSKYNCSNWKQLYFELFKYSKSTCSPGTWDVVINTVLTNCIRYDCVLIFDMLLTFPFACHESQTTSSQDTTEVNDISKSDFGKIQENINYEFLFRGSSLKMACQFESKNIIKYLLTIPNIAVAKKEDINISHQASRDNNEKNEKNINRGIYNRRKSTSNDLHTLSPLLVCLKKNKVAMLEMLISHKSMNLQLLNSLYPLHYAIEQNSIDSAKYLIQFGINVNSYHGNLTPLQIACYEKRNDIILFMLEYCKNKIDINAKSNIKGETSLMIACARMDISQNVNIIQAFLKWRATNNFYAIKMCDIFAMDDNGWNCFMYAAREGNYKAMKYLCDYVKQNYDKNKLDMFINQKSNDFQHNAYSLASKNGSIKTMNFLSKHCKMNFMGISR